MLVKAERVQGDNFDKARELVISNSENQRHEEIDISIVEQHRKLEENARHEVCISENLEKQNERGRRPRKRLGSRASVDECPYK